MMEPYKEVKFCNKCDMSCENKLGGMDGLIDAKVYGAYASASFRDGDSFTFSLCERCLLEIFKTFKTNPYVRNYILNDYPTEEEILREINESQKE